MIAKGMHFVCVVCRCLLVVSAASSQKREAVLERELQNSSAVWLSLERASPDPRATTTTHALYLGGQVLRLAAVLLGHPRLCSRVCVSRGVGVLLRHLSSRRWCDSQLSPRLSARPTNLNQRASRAPFVCKLLDQPLHARAARGGRSAHAFLLCCKMLVCFCICLVVQERARERMNVNRVVGCARRALGFLSAAQTRKARGALQSSWTALRHSPVRMMWPGQ